MNYQEAYQAVVDQFADRLLFLSAAADARGFECTTEAYARLAAHLAERGDFRGICNAWAEDAFAFAFQEVKGFPREWYERMFADMFGGSPCG